MRTSGAGTAMESDLKSGYGIGFMVAREGDWLFYGHGGAVAGYQADAIFNRQLKAGLIILRNVSGGKFDVHGLAVRSLIILAARLRDSHSSRRPSRTACSRARRV